MALSASTAPPAVGFELGIQDDRLLLGAPITADGASIGPSVGLGAARRLGVRSIKMLIHWAAVAPTAKTAPDLSRYDDAVDLARASGFRVQLTLDGPAPAWATANRRVGSQRPSANAFGRLAAVVAAHFKGRVGRYAIWNEPNWHRHLTPTHQAPQLYRALYRAGWKAIRRVDPAARVLFGELAPLGRLEAATRRCASSARPPAPIGAGTRLDRAVRYAPTASRTTPTHCAGIRRSPASRPTT